MVFRPSSHGLNYLTLSWKASSKPFLVAHEAVEERIKANPNSNYTTQKPADDPRESDDDRWPLPLFIRSLTPTLFSSP